MITSLVKSLLHNYSALKYLIKQEMSYKPKLSFWRRIWCLLHGFSSEKFELYNFRENNYKFYLSDFQRHKTSRINSSYSLILNDKRIFSRIFERENITAKTYGNFRGGKIFLNNKETSIDEFLQFLKEVKVVIVKKHNGGGGKGIYKFTNETNELKINNQSFSTDEFINLINSLNDYLIVEHLDQADYSSDIFPDTINSIRIITMRDPMTNEVFIPIAVHKFGSKKTIPVDNVWRGGMTAAINIDTGEIKRSARHFESNKKIEWESLHPDTGKKIEGTIVPNWHKVKQDLLEIAKSVDYLHYVGWDVVVQNEGIKIIEGNNYSDVNILQIHQPLLLDERVKNFYKQHKII